MKSHRPRALVLLLVLLLCVPLHALADGYPAVQDPPYVGDFVDLLSDAQIAELNEAAAQLKDKNGAQVAVALIATTNGVPIGDYAHDLLQTWGVGEAGRDNGALLVLALEDRDVYIAVGDGLSDVMPDSATGVLLDDFFMPHAAQGDFATAARETFLGMIRLAQASASTADPSALLAAQSTYLTDITDSLPASTRDGIISAATRLDQEKGLQICTVLIYSTQDMSIDDYANALYNRWGIGHAGEDKGVLILFALDDGTARIEVGDGLSSLLPDSKAGRLLDAVLAQDLPIDEAVLATFTSVGDALASAPTRSIPAPTSLDRPDEHVLDLGGLLVPDDIKKLNRTADTFYRESGIRTFLVYTQSTGDMSPSLYAEALRAHWQRSDEMMAVLLITPTGAGSLALSAKAQSALSGLTLRPPTLPEGSQRTSQTYAHIGVDVMEQLSAAAKSTSGAGDGIALLVALLIVALVIFFIVRSQKARRNQDPLSGDLSGTGGPSQGSGPTSGPTAGGGYTTPRPSHRPPIIIVPPMSGGRPTRPSPSGKPPSGGQPKPPSSSPWGDLLGDLLGGGRSSGGGASRRSSGGFRPPSGGGGFGGGSRPSGGGFGGGKSSGGGAGRKF